MSGHIEYERRVPIFGRIGYDGNLIELGVMIVEDGDTPEVLDRRMAAFYRSLADALENTPREEAT